MLDKHDILVCNLILNATCQLNILRCLEVYQIVLHDQLGNLISRQRNHTVCNDTSISGNRDIGGTCADIYQGDIQQSIILRNCNIDSCNRLQGHVCHGKSCHSYCCIKSIYNILWQECNDNILTDTVCLMGLQTRKWLIIQIILHHRISYTVELILGVVHLL